MVIIPLRRLLLERASPPQLFTRRYPGFDGSWVLKAVRFAVREHGQTQDGTHQLSLSVGDAFDRDQEQEEEDGEDGEAFGGACLGLGSIEDAPLQRDRREAHTITP